MPTWSINEIILAVCILWTRTPTHEPHVRSSQVLNLYYFRLGVSFKLKCICFQCMQTIIQYTRHIWICIRYQNDPTSCLVAISSSNRRTGSQRNFWVRQHHHEQPAQSLVDAQRSSCRTRPASGHVLHIRRAMFIVCFEDTIGETRQAVFSLAK